MANFKFEEIEIKAKSDELYREAYNSGMTMSALLQEKDPDESYRGTEYEGTDAFERQCARFDIPLKSSFEDKNGIYGRAAIEGKENRFFASDAPESLVLFPEYINRTMRMALIQADILNEIVAVTTGVNSNVYRSFYIQDTVLQRQQMRIAEGAEVPKTILTSSENVVNLFKYGRRLEGTYEFFRRITVDLLSVFLKRIARQTMLDKAATALDVVINGDGNANPATNYNLSALDSTATLPTITYKAWITWCLNFYPYQLTTVIGNTAALISVLTMQFPQINPMTLLGLLETGSLSTTKLEMAQSLFSTIRLVLLPSLVANTLVGIDKEFAMEQVFEIGANLTETDKIITSQFTQIVMTEVVGYDKIIPQACATLTLNA